MAPKKSVTKKAFQQVCLFTQICFVRNVAGIRFPNALPEEERRRLGASLSAVLCTQFAFQDITSDPELKGIVGDYLHLLPEADREPGYRLLRRGADCFCEVMATNHLTFTVRTTGSDFLKIAGETEQFINTIARELPFAIHARYGFLSAQLPLVGTGFRVRSMLHLCGLSHFNHLRELCNAAEMSGVLVELDSPEPPPGHLIILFNRFSLGRSVADILADYSACLQEVIVQELHARQRLLKDEPYVLLDLLSRCSAILRSTRLLAENEAMDALSDIRLAAALGILKPGLGSKPFDPMWFLLPTAGFLTSMAERHPEYLAELPPQVADFQPWRTDAIRANLLRLSADFDLKESFVKRALLQ